MTQEFELEDVVLSGIESHMDGVWTSFPGRVTKYDASKGSVEVQPLVKKSYLDENGDRQTNTLPVITGVPIVFPGAGGFRLTFPVAVGDSVLVIVTSCSLDVWLHNDSIVDPLDDRKQSLTDAVAIPGLRSFSSPLSSAPTTCMTAGKDGGPVIEFDSGEIRVGGAGAQALANETYLTSENTLLIALSVFTTALNVFFTAAAGDANLLASAPATKAAAVVAQPTAATFLGAITTFQAAASTYHTLIAKGK